MSYKDDFNLFVGSMYGIFKGVKATEGHTSIVKHIQSLKHLSKNTNITALAWSDENEEEILLGLSNQLVKSYNTKDKVFCFSTDTRVITENGPSEGNICGLSRLDEALVTATESGHVRVSRYPESKCVNIYAEPISRMRHSKSCRNVIGTGGLNNDLKLWDLNTSKRLFEAKNVPHDWLQLQVKVWASDHAFLPNSDHVAVGSKYGYVRLYDPKAQRRPVINVNIPDQAITCITSCKKDHVVLCGLAKGDIVAVDLRIGKTAEHYKGFLGAVRDIACHPTEPYIVSVGLDRFLRVHHLETKDCLLKEFLVTRMNCVLMRSDFTFKAPKSQIEKRPKELVGKIEFLSDDKSDNDESQQLDEIFESMEEVVDGSTKQSQQRKRHANGKKMESPTKKKKTVLLVNPFAPKAKSEKGKPETKSTASNIHKEKPQDNDIAAEDSDDDLMIISETVCNPSNAVAGTDNEDSERDEADGESDELDSQEEIDEDENEINSANDASGEEDGEVSKATTNSKNHTIVKSNIVENKNRT